MSNQLAAALLEAAQSLETISKNAGKFLDSDGEENMLRHYDQVRGYANSRATVARQALAAHEAAKERTGWPAEGRMAQDDSRELSKWLSNTPGARRLVDEAAKPEPVAWRQPDDTANVRELVWLREKGAVFLGYYFRQPFREYRDADGCYTGQQDSEEYWARYEDGDRCEPDGWHPLQAPVAAPVAGASPLSDEQIKAAAMEAFDSSWDADDETLVNKYGHGVYLHRFIEFARSIEQAHGIKEMKP